MAPGNRVAHGSESGRLVARATGSNARRLLKRATNASGGSTLTQAAASSIAKGRPSRREQISTTAGALASVRLNRAAPLARAPRTARSHRSAPGRLAAARVDSGRLGRVRGGTGNSCSPVTRRAARLVTSALRPGQAPSNR